MKSSRNRLTTRKQSRVSKPSQVTSHRPQKSLFSTISSTVSPSQSSIPVSMTSTSRSMISTSRLQPKGGQTSMATRSRLSIGSTLSTGADFTPISNSFRRIGNVPTPKYIIRPGDDDETEEDVDPNACPRDPLGRPLPTDYQHAHLHSPYEMFHDDTSKVFDPLVYGITEISQIRELYKATIAAVPKEHLKVRATITDPDELHAYDRIMTPLLNPEYYLEHIAHDNGKPYADNHFIFDKFNNPDPDKRYLPHRFGPQNWRDFLIGDFFNGTREMKIRLAIVYVLMYGSVGMLAYDGITGIADYFDSIEYPRHHHPTDH